MKWIALFALLIIVNILVLLYIYYYCKRAEARRLADLTRIVRQIGDGNMIETASEDDDRFRDLASAINDMSANIQEVLILLWKQSTQSLRLIKRFAGCVGCREKIEPEDLAVILQDCKDVEQSHKDCKELLSGLEFFGVNLDTDGSWQHNPENVKKQAPERKN